MLTSITFSNQQVISCICHVFLRQQYFDQGLTLVYHKVDSHISQLYLVDGNKANNIPYSLLFVSSEYFFLS